MLAGGCQQHHQPAYGTSASFPPPDRTSPTSQDETLRYCVYRFMGFAGVCDPFNRAGWRARLSNDWDLVVVAHKAGARCSKSIGAQCADCPGCLVAIDVAQQLSAQLDFIADLFAVIAADCVYDSRISLWNV